jgi:hypothetical protein
LHVCRPKLLIKWCGENGTPGNQQDVQDRKRKKGIELYIWKTNKKRDKVKIYRKYKHGG